MLELYETKVVCWCMTFRVYTRVIACLIPCVGAVPVSWRRRFPKERKKIHKPILSQGEVLDFLAGDCDGARYQVKAVDKVLDLLLLTICGNSPCDEGKRTE